MNKWAIVDKNTQELEDSIFSGIETVHVYLSGSRDPGINLSLEEELFETLPEKSLRCFLYINRPTLVIGRHQNPWKEIRLDRMRDRGLRFYRRISGGGTVYHDLGNLNFSFLLPQSSYDKGKIAQLVLDFLNTLGVNGSSNERGDLLWDGRKFSGNAYRISRGKVLHHGTLLVNADLDGLHGLLGSMPGRFETRAVSSVPSPVVNLSSVLDGVEAHQVMEKWREWWSTKGSSLATSGWEGAYQDAVAKRRPNHDNQDWVYGETPKFEYFPPEGGRVVVRNGTVVSSEPEELEQFVPGKAFRLLSLEAY